MNVDNKERDRQSFIRWQEITRSQLTYAINLFLSFSIAILGFQVSLLMNTSFLLFPLEKIFFSWSLLLVSCSTLQGVIAVLCRLRSFRTTVQITKQRSNFMQWKTVRHKRLLVKRLDRNTWRSFCWQIVFLGLGVFINMLLIFNRLL